MHAVYLTLSLSHTHPYTLSSSHTHTFSLTHTEMILTHNRRLGEVDNALTTKVDEQAWQDTRYVRVCVCGCLCTCSGCVCVLTKSMHV
jgi:hypothetical protein